MSETKQNEVRDITEIFLKVVLNAISQTKLYTRQRLKFAL